jgi:hypothetical protein
MDQTRNVYEFYVERARNRFRSRYKLSSLGCLVLVIFQVSKFSERHTIYGPYSRKKSWGMWIKIKVTLLLPWRHIRNTPTHPNTPQKKLGICLRERQLYQFLVFHSTTLHYDSLIQAVNFIEPMQDRNQHKPCLFQSIAVLSSNTLHCDSEICKSTSALRQSNKYNNSISCSVNLT